MREVMLGLMKYSVWLIMLCVFCQRCLKSVTVLGQGVAAVDRWGEVSKRRRLYGCALHAAQQESRCARRYN